MKCLRQCSGSPELLFNARTYLEQKSDESLRNFGDGRATREIVVCGNYIFRMGWARGITQVMHS